MHELSIAQALVEMAVETAEGAGAVRVTVVRIRLGSLASVVEDALRFSFDVAAAGTPAEGAVLEVERVGLAVHCPRCNAERILAIPSFWCPVCGGPAPTVVRGKECELASIEVLDE